MKVLVVNVFIFYIMLAKLLANNNGMPTQFIGVYNEANSDTITNLIRPNTSNYSPQNNWGLTEYTEELLELDFKAKLRDNKFNLVLKKDLEKSFDEANDIDIDDKKIGFFNIDTFQSVDKQRTGKDLVTITINLIFVQIGKEVNRADSEDVFEVRYTNGITINGLLEVAPNDVHKNDIIHASYRQIYKDAVEKLIDLIISDKKVKQTDGFDQSNDIYVSIDKVVIGKKAKSLIANIYDNEDETKKQIMMLMQENLIKAIREDSSLSDVVLLYPGVLSQVIYDNWSDYLARIRKLNNTEDSEAKIVIRKIKPVCVENEDEYTIALNGYFIEAMVTELYDKVVEEDDIDSVHAMKSGMVARIVLPLDKKKKVDSLSLPSNVIKKISTSVGQSSEGYTIDNDYGSVRKNKATKIIRKSINKVSLELVKTIKKIVKVRNDALDIEYKDFCQKEY